MDSVLVVQVYTKNKEYCRHLYPKIFDSLTYKNKVAGFIDEKNYPPLFGFVTNEEGNAIGHQMGINIAISQNIDWILFLDLDIEPDVDIIQKMLAVKHPIVGSLVASKNGTWQIMGYNYKNRKTLDRVWLKKSEVNNNQEVDSISGSTLLVARGIFNKVNYSGYTGSNTIPGRYTSDDEYLLLNIFKHMKIRPKICSNAFSWHYNEDGHAYKIFNKIKVWKV